MKRIRDIFKQNHRLRTGWRLLIFLLVVFPSLYYLTILFWEELLIRYIIIFSLLLGFSFIAARFLDGRPIITIGFYLRSRALKEYLIGVTIGFVLVLLLFLIYVIPGYIEVELKPFSYPLLKDILVIALITSVFQTAFEELFFRGYILQNLIEGTTLFIAILVTSVVFGIGHLLTPHSNWLTGINLSVFGGMHAICYVKTRSLLLPSGLHFGWNFFMRNIFSMPVSGTSVSSSLMEVRDKGPELITGGAYGPEAGIPALILMLLCSWLILKSRRITPLPLIENMWKEYWGR